jgi:broad specificity phosphatase PhoE
MATQVRLLLIRHGETNWNYQHRYQGQTDTELSARGEEQATRIGNALRYEALTAVYSSDLRRAVHTAEIAMAAYESRSGRRAPDLSVKPAIAEMAFGAWEGFTHDELIDRKDHSYHQWIQDPWSAAPPEGEDLRAYAKRTTECIQGIVAGNPEGCVAVITHGGVIRMIVSKVLESFAAGIERIDVAPGSITRVTYFDDTPILTSLNETGHLMCEFFM